MESGTQAVQAYFAEAQKVHAQRNATEHSYRPALKALLEAVGNAGKEGQDKITATWLRDRKRRGLRYGDIEHYQRTVAALAETARLMERVDEAIEEAGRWPLG